MAYRSINSNDGKLLVPDHYAKNTESLPAPATLHPRVGEAHTDSSPPGALFCVDIRNFPYGQPARVALTVSVDAGRLVVNNLDWADAELPFGAVKRSGYGREPGGVGIQAFVNKKLVRSGHIAAPV